MKLPENYKLIGPHYHSHTLSRLCKNSWMLTREYKKSDKKTFRKELYKRIGFIVGEIQQFDDKKFIIPNTHPIKNFDDLNDAVNYLIKKDKRNK